MVARVGLGHLTCTDTRVMTATGRFGCVPPNAGSERET